ncbi:MAG TPA: hypothetical protein VMB47_05680 [Candidatus Aquilonibacter sp.]|nr:hypothetical protein [Candidatus Aquilonibacter sp.]
MLTNRFSKCVSALISAVALISLCFLLSNPAVAAGPNLYQDVMSHKADIAWRDAPATNYPDDACNLLDACSAGGAPKVFILPTATIGGHRTARAVYLVKISDPKQPEAVIFEHQTAGDTYFFRVAPDGSVTSVAYLATGSGWVPVAPENGLASSTFQKDAPDWHAALEKGGK